MILKQVILFALALQLFLVKSYLGFQKWTEIFFLVV